MGAVTGSEWRDVARNAGSARPRGTWSREWRFLIWTWTITTWDDYCFVRTVQRRFLGQDVVRTYSKLIWMVAMGAMALMCVAATVALTVLCLAMAEHGESAGGLAYLLVMVCLLLVSVYAVFIYFTFIPPRRDQSSW